MTAMWQDRDFMRVWSGQVVSNLGDGIGRVTVLWWARHATGSDALVVMVALATVLPGVLVAPIAGWVVDRYPRRALMLAADAIRFCTSAILATAATTGVLTTGLVISVSVFAALAAAVFDPALASSITQMVPPTRRASANSLIGANRALGGIVGPAVGGVLIGVAGTASALWIDAVTFVASFLLIAASRIPMPVAVLDGSADGGMAGGFRVLRRDREIRDLVVVAAGLNLVVAPVPVLIVGLAAGPLDLGGVGFGLLMAAVPTGLLAGLALAPRLTSRRPAALLALLMTGAAIAITASATWAWIAGAWLALAGVGVGVANTLIQTTFQGRVAPELQGRVFAVVGAFSMAGQPVGLLLTAPLVAGVGVRGGLVASGVGLMAITLAGRRGLSADESPVEPALVAR